MLPTFLGIGAPKAGTTWVHRLLASHPDVAVPEHRKEVHYFDRNFARGREWYEQFFPANTATRAIGEFTPHYLYDPAVPGRVPSVPTIVRFVCILRNPVDRAFSHYRFRQRQENRHESFEQFLVREPAALAWGYYGRHLAEWYGRFDPDRFLVLEYDEAVADPDGTKRRLSALLDIDVAAFPEAAGTERVNEALVPRRARTYASAVRQARWLRRHDLDRVISLARRSGVVAALKRPAAASSEAVPPDVRARLWADFEPDVCRLEDLTGMDLAHWRPEAA